MRHASHIRAEGARGRLLKQCSGEGCKEDLAPALGKPGWGLVGLQLSATLAEAVPR